MPEPLPEIPLRERVVVGVGSVESRLVVVCQDGTGFVLFGANAVRDKSEWHELPPIPGTPRHYQQLGAAMDGAG